MTLKKLKSIDQAEELKGTSVRVSPAVHVLAVRIRESAANGHFTALLNVAVAAKAVDTEAALDSENYEPPMFVCEYRLIMALKDALAQLEAQ